MQVEIKLKAVVVGNGEVRLFHECKMACNDDERTDVFGIPGRRLDCEDAFSVCAQLAPWIVKRFAIEVEAAIKRAMPDNPPVVVPDWIPL